MTSLSDLPDSELNALCCKALGWQYIKVSPQFEWYKWLDANGYELYDAGGLEDYFNFCQSLDQVQQYLVPVIKGFTVKQKRRYVDVV